MRRLRDEGYGVASIAEDSPGITDAEVLVPADRERRVVITFDRDFGELLYRYQAQYKQFAGVMYLRFRPRSPVEAAEQILAVLRHPQITLQGMYLSVCIALLSLC